MTRALVFFAAIAAAALGFGAAACSQKPQRAEGAAPAALTGTWRADGVEAPGPDGVRPPSWQVTYTFGAHGYRMEAHPPAREAAGKVTVLGQDGPRLRLRLRLEPHREPDREVEFELEEDGHSFLFEGFRYLRQNP